MSCTVHVGGTEGVTLRSSSHPNDLLLKTRSQARLLLRPVSGSRVYKKRSYAAVRQEASSIRGCSAPKQYQMRNGGGPGDMKST